MSFGRKHLCFQVLSWFGTFQTFLQSWVWTNSLCPLLSIDSSRFAAEEIIYFLFHNKKWHLFDYIWCFDGALYVKGSCSTTTEFVQDLVSFDSTLYNAFCVYNAFCQSKWLPRWRKDMSNFQWWQFDFLIRGCHCQLLELSLLFNKLSCLPFEEWNQLAFVFWVFIACLFIFSFPQMVQ